MKENTEMLDRIERFSKGKMSLEERRAFEAELASDESLREQWQYSEIVDQMIIGNEAWNLKAQMQKDLYRPKIRIWNYLGASLLVLVTSGTLFFFFNKKEEKVQVAASTKLKEKAENKVVSVKSLAEQPKKMASQAKKTNTIASTSILEEKSGSVQPSAIQPTYLPNVAGSERAEKAPNQSQNAIVPKLDPCAGFVGNVEFYTLPSCKGQETGEVRLKTETVKGGVAPFTFKLGERSGKGMFDRVASGHYSLFIKDANDCVVENSKKVIVEEKICMYKNEYVFNPEYDPSWPIPYNHEKQATGFKIIEKSGKIFFQTPVSASQPSEWKGEGNMGLTLGMGIYFFSIEYADGSVDEGTIVVTR